MKRIVALILLLLIIAVSVPVSANAVGYYDIPKEAYERLASGAASYGEYTDMQEFGLDAEDIALVYREAIFLNPMLFFAVGGYQYSVGSDGIIKKVFYKYTMTKEDSEAAVAFVNEKLDAIVATIPAGLDDFETAAYIFDYICLNFRYTTEGTPNNDIYGMLRDGHGICQGYALLYRALLERVGIESFIVTSNNPNHAWNEVKLGGVWYYTDATWGDPRPDTPGKARHRFFLGSEALFRVDHGNEAVPHNPLDDTSYDNAFWRDCDFSFAYASGETYCIVGNSIRRFSIKTGEYSEVYSVPDVWFVYGTPNYYKDICFTQLGSYANKVLFNTPEQVMAYDPADGSITPIYTLEREMYIYGMYTSGSKAYLRLSTNANDITEIAELDLVPILGEFHEHRYSEPELIWAEDFRSAVLTCECACGDVLEIEATVKSVYHGANGDEPGFVVYTAEAVLDGVKYTEENENGFLSAAILSGKDGMEISVFGNEDRILLTARYDNLGKGASGAAIECLNIVSGNKKEESLTL
ncbi:MAG: hypothetical protein J5793_04805 [Clostridia bacterium]|nr:hypothetical protein [Clostridia bacterium]